VTRPDVVVSHTEALERARSMLIADRAGEAEALGQWVAASTQDPAERGHALVLCATALLNMGRPEQCREAVQAGLATVRGLREPYLLGHLNALAALTHRHDALENAVIHLVHSARAMRQANPTDPITPWGWHDLAMAYSYLGFHGHAVSAIEQARTLAVAVGMPEERFAAPGIRVRNATSLDHHGDTDGCVRVLRAVAADLARHERSGHLELVRPSGLAAYGYAVARLAALGHRLDVDACAAFRRGGGNRRARDLRALGEVCLAIRDGQPDEALDRLEKVEVSPDTLGPAEVPRLRALAHLRAGDFRAAYEADREVARAVAAGADRLRDTFVEGVAARLEHGELRRTAARYAGDALTDPLTGLPNRRHLERYVDEMIDRGEQAVVGVCDLDGFKLVNTVHGHLAGDLVLQRVSGIIARVMRRGDFVARYGGDEFVVVLPSTTLSDAADVAHRIVAAVRTEDWHGLVPGTPIAVSIGWADVAGPQMELGRALVQAFEAADRAMLRAKTRVRAS